MKPGKIEFDGDKSVRVGARSGGFYTFVVLGEYSSGLRHGVGARATIRAFIKVGPVDYVQYFLSGGARTPSGVRIMRVKQFASNYKGQYTPRLPAPPEPRGKTVVPPTTARSLLSDSIAEALTELVQGLVARVASLEGRIYTAENLLKQHGIRRV